MSVDTDIDALYQLAPSDFVSARNALAKKVNGDDAARVRSLGKPTVPAWAINQLYWRDRRAFDRIARAGADLRRAQIAALQGKAAEVREATASHREAIAAAVQRTIAIAREAGVRVDADAITRSIEALSLSPGDVTPGRLTKPLQPAGFEALAGVKVADLPEPRRVLTLARAPGHQEREQPDERDAPGPRIAAERDSAAKQRALERREEAKRRTAEKQAAARRRALEAAVERARQEEARARHALAEAQKQLADAELRLRNL